VEKKKSVGEILEKVYVRSGYEVELMSDVWDTDDVVGYLVGCIQASSAPDHMEKNLTG
jgi:hypothetical protein